MAVAYYKDNHKHHKVIQIDDSSTTGFFPVVKGTARGMQRVAEWFLEDNFTQCDKYHFDKCYTAERTY
jgi:N-acetyl-gamma-glutamylphosphate reductase